MKKITIIVISLAAAAVLVIAGLTVLKMRQAQNIIKEPLTGKINDFSQNQGFAGTIIVLVKAGRFEPNTIRVLAGNKYKLKVKNQDNFPHALVLLDLGIDTGRINPGKEEEHEFETPIVDKQKIYEFYSSIPGQRGITGSLIIDPNPALKNTPLPSL